MRTGTPVNELSDFEIRRYSYERGTEKMQLGFPKQRLTPGWGLLCVSVLLNGGLIAEQSTGLEDGSSLWLHVRVEEAGTGEKVNVNIPLSVVDTMLPLMEKQHLSKGKAELHKNGLTVKDLREVWKTLRAQGDTVIVGVESSDADFRVFIENDDLIIESEENSKKQIHVNIPAQLVDGLLSGEGDELNLAAALRILQGLGSRDFVSVRDEKATVQVWIDERGASR